jgi:DNA-binding protein HU-beta
MFRLAYALRRYALRRRRNLPGEKMNKADLINRIAAGSRISKAQAATAIDTSVDAITAALKKGDRVALIGFGTFSVSQRKARNGRNPQTGATIKIAARRVAKFTPGAELKKAVNRGR